MGWTDLKALQPLGLVVLTNIQLISQVYNKNKNMVQLTVQHKNKCTIKTNSKDCQKCIYILKGPVNSEYSFKQCC